MSDIEDGDLDVILHMGVILMGKFRDLVTLRKEIRRQIVEKKGRFIHGTISNVDLYIVKEDAWRKLKDLELVGGESKNG